MMINRHNYEEFFLLYADDELNHQQRAAVELFVQQNPDMAAELETLLQMKFEPEEGIVFPDKSILFKTTDVEININNYEEFFLLYIDRELDAPTSEKVEKFVLQHPQLQDEFTLLKQTVLQPEAITFADKSLLYRKEERKVGYIRFVRIAAAAALIALVLTGWWLYPKTATNGVKNSVAINKTPGKLITPVIVSKQKAVIPQTVPLPKQGIKADFSEVKKHEKVVTPSLARRDSSQDVQQKPAPFNAGNNDVAVNDNGVKPAEKPEPTIAKTDVDVSPEKNKIIAVVPPMVESRVKSGNQTSLTGTNGIKPVVDPIVVNDGSNGNKTQTVAYKEIDTNDDDRSMYIGSLDLNKDKIKGFLKRAGRFFWARPKKDTD